MIPFRGGSPMKRDDAKQRRQPTLSHDREHCRTLPCVACIEAADERHVTTDACRSNGCAKCREQEDRDDAGVFTYTVLATHGESVREFEVSATDADEARMIVERMLAGTWAWTEIHAIEHEWPGRTPIHRCPGCGSGHVGGTIDGRSDRRYCLDCCLTFQV